MKDRRKAVRPASRHQQSPADELVATLADGNSVVVTGYAASAVMLDGLSEFLARTRTRVIRVRPPLDLPDLMEQIVRADAAPADAALEEAFLALTVPGDGYERIALLVDGAHLMTHATLRYLDFAFWAAPGLQAILAGQPAIADTLALDGFASLRARFSLHVDWSGTTTSQLADTVVLRPIPVAGTLVSTFFAAIMPPLPYRMTPARLLASAAVAASFALAVASTIQPPSPAIPSAVVYGLNNALVGMDAEPGGRTAPAVMAVDRSTPEPEDGTTISGRQPEGQSPGPGLAGPNLPAAEHKPQTTPGFVAAEPSSQNTREPLAEAPRQVAPLAAFLPVPAEPHPAALTNPDASQAPEPVGGPEVTAWVGGPTSVPADLDLLAPSVVVPAEAAAEAETRQDLDLPLPPIPPQAPSRARAIRSERVATRVPSAPRDQRCGAIILRTQVGETPTDSERSFLRNGCR